MEEKNRTSFIHDLVNHYFYDCKIHRLILEILAGKD